MRLCDTTVYGLLKINDTFPNRAWCLREKARSTHRRGHRSESDLAWSKPVQRPVYTFPPSDVTAQCNIQSENWHLSNFATMPRKGGRSSCRSEDEFAVYKKFLRSKPAHSSLCTVPRDRFRAHLYANCKKQHSLEILWERPEDRSNDSRKLKRGERTDFQHKCNVNLRANHSTTNCTDALKAPSLLV